MQAIKESISDFLGRGAKRPDSTRRHLQATIDWLCRAHDAGDDDGVSRMYNLKYGWGASYPETTGYIIPTFLHYSRLTGDPEYRERALRMADWESRVQMREGAVQGGTVADEPSPAIFNTGQVLFGWVAAMRETGAERYRRSAQAAAEYLVNLQDRDGLWRRNLSRFCSATSETYAFNVRSAWALVLAGDALGVERLREAGARNIEAVVELALKNGWLRDNCLDDPLHPLLHTIAYSFQGLLEGGLLVNNDRAVDLALTGSTNLRNQFNKRGNLYGRYDDQWRPVVTWRCLTGEAQTAVIWFRLAELTGESEWRRAAEALNARVKATQKLEGRADVVGAVKGSYPVYAEYGQYEFPNWAAKFFADALMQQAGFRVAGTDG